MYIYKYIRIYHSIFVYIYVHFHNCKSEMYMFIYKYLYIYKYLRQSQRSVYLYIYIYISIFVYTYTHSIFDCLGSLFFLERALEFSSSFAQPIAFWSKEPPSSEGVSYLLCSLIMNPEEEGPPQIELLLCAAYCIWRVIQSSSPISISLVSFQRNVAKET